MTLLTESLGPLESTSENESRQNNEGRADPPRSEEFMVNMS
jgi:hypothetical protein